MVRWQWGRSCGCPSGYCRRWCSSCDGCSGWGTSSGTEPVSWHRSASCPAVTPCSWPERQENHAVSSAPTASEAPECRKCDASQEILTLLPWRNTFKFLTSAAFSFPWTNCFCRMSYTLQKNLVCVRHEPQSLKINLYIQECRRCMLLFIVQVGFF